MLGIIPLFRICYFEFDSDNLVKLTKNAKEFSRGQDCKYTYGIRKTVFHSCKKKKKGK